MRWPGAWLPAGSERCAGSADGAALPSWHLCHLSFVVINCQNMAGVCNANQTETPWATLPGMLVFLSRAVYVMGRIEVARCLGTTSKRRSSSWSALVFALGWSNKRELLKVLILGFRACFWPRPTGRERWHKFPLHIPMTTVSALAIRWTQPVSFTAKLEERLTFYFCCKPEWSFSAERATSLSNPESLKKGSVCESVWLELYHSLFSGPQKVSKPSHGASSVDSVTPEWLWKGVRVIASCQIKKVAEPVCVGPEQKPRFISAS